MISIYWDILFFKSCLLKYICFSGSLLTAERQGSFLFQFSVDIKVYNFLLEPALESDFIPHVLVVLYIAIVSKVKNVSPFCPSLSHELRIGTRLHRISSLETYLASWRLWKTNISSCSSARWSSKSCDIVILNRCDLYIDLC